MWEILIVGIIVAGAAALSWRMLRRQLEGKDTACVCGQGRLGTGAPDDMGDSPAPPCMGGCEYLSEDRGRAPRDES